MGLVLVAAMLRFPALFANHFAADEALFATWARWIATWRDPLLQLQPLDKPPLAFYLQALGYPMFGPVEWAARLPNFAASLCLVPLVWLLAWRLFGERKTAVFAAAFMALSPFPVQFSATAFLDPLLVTWLTASLTARRGRWAGLWFGLAVATKYQAWLWLPLLWWSKTRHGWTWRAWLTGLGVVLVGLVAWNLARRGSLVAVPSLWLRQWQNYGGLRLIWSWEVWPRALAWGELFGWLLGHPVLLPVFAGLMGWWRWRQGGPAQSAAPVQETFLLLYLLAYLLLHWLLAVPVWERYLLPLTPVVALLGGRAQTALGAVVEKGWYPLFLLLVVGWMGGMAWGAGNGRYPIGGQVWADQGAGQLAQSLTDAPYGTVLYDHWYSWQWRYHLFDRRVFINWLPDPVTFRADLAAFGHDGLPRYLALPYTPRANPFIRAVDEAGFSLIPIRDTGPGGIILYRLVAVDGEIK